jgi:hypothetical protein
MPTKRPPKAPPHADDENIKTVKLSANELRQQLAALGVNMDGDDDGTGDDEAKSASSASSDGP